MLIFPYARLRMRTDLSEEECLKRLKPIVQSPKRGIKAIIFKPEPNSDKIIFQGRVSRDKFLMTRLERQRLGSRQAPPPRISGVLRSALGGTDVVIQVSPDWGAIIICTFNFALYGYVAVYSVCLGMRHDMFILTWAWLLGIPYLLRSYSRWLMSPVSTEVQAIHQTLAQLFQVQDRKIMLR